MLISTDFVKSSGQGTPVFSKAAALNRFQHKFFVERHFESQRQKSVLETLDEEYRGGNEYLPEIMQTAQEKTAAVEIDKIMQNLLKRSKSETRRGSS